MALQTLFDHASSVMTLVSFITFGAILWWAFVRHKEADFATAAALPFADDEEKRHG
jgi:cytochrome c oxidase cbb3-type subunit 4